MSNSKRTTATTILSNTLISKSKTYSSLKMGVWEAIEFSDDSNHTEDEGSHTRKNPCHDDNDDDDDDDDWSSSSSWMECEEETLPWMKDDSTTNEESLSSKESICPEEEPPRVTISIRSKHSRTAVRERVGIPDSPSEIQIIRGENNRLKKEVFRLRVESREKDALIAILESQITALVVSGQQDDDNKIENENDIENDKNSNNCEDDDIESVEESTPCKRSTIISESSSTVSHSSSLTIPPRRSSVEMRHPPAPISRKKISLLPSTSRKACFQKSTAAIKALPRELSISNHSRYFLEDDEDGDERKHEISRHRRQLQWQQKQKRHKPLSETYTVTDMEFLDAFNSRGIYTGTVQRATQMPHGKGKMVYHRGGWVGGRYYDGDWHTGHWHGSGILRDASGDIYKGQLVNDLREGIGTMQFTDGRIFQGRFSEDEPCNGTMSYIDGAQYEGDLHHGNRHGLGVYRFSDGSYYEGKSVMNLFEGFGKMTWSDGGWYEGDWSRGEIHGFGKEIRPDGSLRHDGRWIKGVPVRIQNHCRLN
eukprot:CAMPEP_0116133946 /NCGR_PEP_ID=MMETSP0329-20121206/10385_1 /TAXON_ID=697910 /ORGANISM="Pseudo-nitzschia arenysensis, Strain B593" /LENGTH=535 /DNA_ID=CAMNT_0003628627 /DNA_START=185 /DNA_END=1792 /DNA_ORIENTATION=-